VWAFKSFSNMSMLAVFYTSGCLSLSPVAEFHGSCTIWNSLPPSIVNFSSLARFIIIIIIIIKKADDVFCSDTATLKVNDCVKRSVIRL